jgi:hypothetical protein
MQNIFLIVSLLFILTGCSSPLTTANRNAKRNEQTVVYPEVKFDSIYAKSQLSKGKATIKGVLFKKTNKIAIVGGYTFGYKKEVVLLPVTDYLLEWHKLRATKENKKTSVYLSEQAYSFRLVTVTDENGRFFFNELKPGKYFLQAYMSKTNYFTRDVVVGTDSYGTKYYKQENYSEMKKYRNEKFVEIKNDGEIIEIKLN